MKLKWKIVVVIDMRVKRCMQCQAIQDMRWYFIKNIIEMLKREITQARVIVISWIRYHKICEIRYFWFSRFEFLQIFATHSRSFKVISNRHSRSLNHKMLSWKVDVRRSLQTNASIFKVHRISKFVMIAIANSIEDSRAHIEHLIKHQLIVCKSCRYVVWSKQIQQHYQESQHRWKKQVASELTTTMQSWLDVIQYSIELKMFNRVNTIIVILSLHDDELLCQINLDICQYVCRNVKWMKTHCKQKHDWV